MKKILTLMFAAVISLAAFAQGRFGPDSAECVKYLSYYKEYLKQNNNEEAIGPWRKAYALCPATASQNLLLDGQKLMRWAYRKTKDAKARAGYIDTLMALYDARIANYPKTAVTALNNKAIDIVNFKWNENNPQAVYDEMKNIFAATGDKSSDLVYVKLMESAATLYNDGKIGAEQVMSDYTGISETIGKALAAKDDEKLRKAQKDAETLFMNCGVADCDNLLAMLAPRFEANPDDEDNIRSVVKLLSAADCLDSELYLKAVEALYAKDPSAGSAYLLYKLYSRKDEASKAVKYLNEAINNCDPGDSATLASYYFELGAYNYKKAGNPAGAVAAAKKAAELSEDYRGRAYLLIGTIWGTARCGGDEIETIAHFWVAYDYVTRAKAADASLTAEANALAGQYQAYFPSSADAFMYNLTNGQSYNVSCGALRETTTVRVK